MYEIKIYLIFVFFNRYELMIECWMEELVIWFSFFQLVEKLELIILKDIFYIDFSKYDEFNLYYNIFILINDEDGL